MNDERSSGRQARAAPLAQDAPRAVAAGSGRAGCRKSPYACLLRGESLLWAALGSCH